METSEKTKITHEMLGLKEITSDNLDPIEKIIFEYRPICYLHPNEEYYPIKIESYLENSNMMLLSGKTPNLKTDKVIEIGDPQYLNAKGYFVPKDYQYKNIINKELINFIKNKEIDYKIRGKYLNKVPYYIIKNENLETGELFISYGFFFGFNGAAKMLYNLIQIEDHFADLEHITIKFEKNLQGEYELKNIYFAAHNGGQLVEGKQLNKVMNGKRPIVYTAINSHASYIKSGVYFRIGGYGNDVTSGKGIVWDPERLQLLKDDGLLFKYKYDLGFKSSLPFSKIKGGETSVTSFGSKKWGGNKLIGGKTEVEKIQGLFIPEYIYNLILISLIIVTKYFEIKLSNNDSNLNPLFYYFTKFCLIIFSFYLGSILKNKLLLNFSMIVNLISYIISKYFDSR